MNEFDDLDELEREFGPALRVALRRVAADIPDDASAWSTRQIARLLNGEQVDAIDERDAYTAADDLPRGRHPRRRWMLVAAATIVVLALGLLAVTAVQDSDSVQTDTVPDTTTPSTTPAPSTNPAPVAEGPVTTAPPETTTPAAIPMAQNGLIAFASTSAESGDEIYVVAPDGTGLRALTSTPDEAEIAPAWSPDGTRLAFLRNVRRSFSASGELVVIDPATGVETFSADIPMDPISDLVGRLWWSPDGRRIALNLANSPVPALIVDGETQTWTTVSGRVGGWSPDGKWLVLGVLQSGGPLLLVPTVLLDDTTNLVVDSNVFGVRPLPLLGSLESVSWMPDSSAVAVTLHGVDSVQVATISDGQYRTLIEDGVESSWSPDGRQLAYLRCDANPEVWVAAADGTGARLRTTSDTPPIWSPDGSLLLVAGPDGVFTVRPDGSNNRTILTPNTPHPAPPDGCLDPPGHGSTNGPVWQPLPPVADTGETTASAATDE